MNDRPSTTRLSDESTVAPPADDDLAEVIRRRPELVGDRPAFLDMVQADYWRCCRSGATLSASTYCNRLPIDDEGLLLSIRRLVEVERYFLENPDLLNLTGEPEWPTESALFGGFRLEKEIGRGAASRVFRARQLELGNRVVVLKVTTYAKAEANVMGQSDHPGVVPVYSTGVEESSGLHWICMPYLGERTLQTELDHRRTRHQGDAAGLPADEALLIAAGLSDALAYLHQRGIQHGDLKPSNVLLREDGRPMLIDFNLSQIDSAENALVGGTLPYMAPEVLRLFVAEKAPSAASSLGHDRAIAADVYAFGCTLYQVLTGRPVVEIGEAERDPKQIAVRMLESQLEGVEGIVTALQSAPTRLAQITTECLALNPLDRPRSFTRIAGRLRQPTSRASAFDSRPLRVLVVTGGLVLLVLLVATRSWSPEARLREAQRLVDQQRWGEAQALLTSIESDPMFGIRAKRLRGESLLDEGKIAEAADALEEVAVETKDASSYALAGYVRHLEQQDEIAESHDRNAMARGRRTASLQNNYAAGLLRELPRHFEAATSAEISRLLTEALQQDPRSETIRINALRHIEILSSLEQGHDYSIVNLVSPSLDEPSTDYLRLACRYLAMDAVSDEELTRLGVPLLEELAKEFDAAGLETLLGKRRWERYRKLPGFDLPKPRGFEKSLNHPAPPVFLDPRQDG
jgi:serine/threonine protein kinase